MLSFLLDSSVRIVMAAAAVGLVLVVFRVRSGAARHAAWSAVLLAMLTMPVLTAIVPRVDVPVPSTLAFDPGTIASWDERPEHAVGTVHSAAASVETPDSTTPPLPATQPSPAPGDRFDWMLAASAAWAAGVLFFTLRLGAGWSLARRLLRHAKPIPLPDDARVLESDAVAVPLTMGILSPSIVLPSGWHEWPADKLAAVLAHERAHLTRRDPLVSLAARVNRAIFWFHPLAWWLEHTLAVTAEHACDETAARTLGEPRRYAEILLDMTEAVRLRGARVAWPAIGVDGSGLLGVRIDRLLRGDALARMSASRRLVTVVACAAALVLAIACRQQVAATPLREDPEVSKRLADAAARTSRFRTSITMTTKEADALEARIARDPNDWDARERLVTYYRAGTSVPWDRKVPGLRRHALWLIEHHPEHEIQAPPLSPDYDPAGFAEAVRLWDAHLSKPDVSPYLVFRAARFFAPYDKARAEALILRGMQMDRQSEALKARMPRNTAGYAWSSQLATLYAEALTGVQGGNPVELDSKSPQSPFAVEVRRKLASSTDAELLARVGSSVLSYLRFQRNPSSDAAPLGRSYVERAVELRPDSEVVQRARKNLARLDKHQRVWEAIRTGSPVAAEDRLDYLAQKAQHDYTLAEYHGDQRKNEAVAKTKLGDARKAAEEALELAKQNPQSPDAGGAIFSAHQTLALVALREGDRDRAVHHMRESVSISTLDPEFDDGLGSRVANYLLKEGERESVVAYLERYAELSPARRDMLLADAAAVRQGRMPESYQRLFANPQTAGGGQAP